MAELRVHEKHFILMKKNLLILFDHVLGGDHGTITKAVQRAGETAGIEIQEGFFEWLREDDGLFDSENSLTSNLEGRTLQ